MLINVHETPKVSAEGQGYPQRMAAEGETKVITSFITHAALGLAVSY